MKKILCAILCASFFISTYSQDNYFKYNGTSDVLLRYLPRGSGGRALVHDIGNVLVLNHSGDFTGGVRIASDLNVTEKITAKRLFIGPTSESEGWRTSNIEYPGHRLRIGSAQGYSTHNIFEFVPGTNANALRYTVLNLCTSNTLDAYKSVIQLHTSGNSYLNGGNVGIGTENPAYKLDVNGEIRAIDGLRIGSYTKQDNKIVLRSLLPYTVNESKAILSFDFGNTVAAKISAELTSNGSNLVLGTSNSGSAINRMTINHAGNVGIGTETPTQKLDVAGNIKANGAYINGIVYTNEVKVEATTWADFVFDKDYKLPALSEVENHINEHKHLPNIPSEAEVKENGVSLGEMQAKLLQKIEELTLYVIQQDKTIKNLEDKVQKLEAK